MRNGSWGNPLLSGDILTGTGSRGAAMSRSGVAVWLLIHMAALLLAASFTWNQAYKAWGGFDFSTLTRVETGETNSKGEAITKVVVVDRVTGEHKPVPQFDMKAVNRLLWVGVIGGLIAGFIVISAKESAPLMGPIYAAFEGLALGGISATYEVTYPGIVMQSFAATVLVMVVMFVLFTARIIRATGPVVAVVIASMLGVLGVYLVDAIMGFWGDNLSIVHGNGWGAIAFSLFVCGLAAFNFIIDFESIEEGMKGQAPSYMNAYSAFSVMVTLVWLYLEILRLIAKFKSKD